jgi:hypothetical protein
MSADDRRERDESRERDIELAVDNLNPPGVTAEAAEQVKGGLTPGPSAGPVPIPYPNIAPPTRLPGVSTASGNGSA